MSHVYQELSYFVTTLLISLLTVGKITVDEVVCAKHNIVACGVYTSVL